MRLSVLLVAGILSVPPAAAQAPSSLGTAAGLSGTAVTHSRRSDAVLWNPALVGIFDGPERTTSLLAIDAASLPGSDGFDAAARLGLLSGRAEDGRLDGFGRPLLWSGGSPEVAAGVRWVAAQSRDLALTLETRSSAHADVPRGLAEQLGVRGVDPAIWESGRSARSLTSVLGVARGAYLGELPVLGRVWAGAAVKGWWVHEFASGAFLADVPDVPRYRETVLGNAGGIGVDAGVAGWARGRIWYGVSLSNLYSTTFSPGRAPRTRTVDVIIDPAGDVEFRESFSSAIRDDDPDADAVLRAEQLWDDTRFPSVLRVGLAWEGRWGTVAAAASEQIAGGGLDPRNMEPARSFAWQDAGRRFRLSYGSMDGRSAVAAAVSAGRCDRRWTAGVRRSQAGPGFSLDLSLSDWSCNLRGQGR